MPKRRQDTDAIASRQGLLWFSSRKCGRCNDCCPGQRDRSQIDCLINCVMLPIHKSPNTEVVMLDITQSEPAKSRSPEAWIKGEYIARRKRNESYSLRAFASRIDMSVGHLSEILSGKKRL